MEHDAHQTKVLALGIALLVSTALIVLSMHDAEMNPSSMHALRVRDAPSNDAATRATRADDNTASPRAEGKRVPLLDHR